MNRGVARYYLYVASAISAAMERKVQKSNNNEADETSEFLSILLDQEWSLEVVRNISGASLMEQMSTLLIENAVALAPLEKRHFRSEHR